MLATEEYTKFMIYFRQNILATDLTVHLLENRLAIEEICNGPTNCKNAIDWNNDKHCMLVRGLVMTTADLCGLAKPFRVAERLAKRLFIEFYNQGDVEVKMGFNPMPTMDRNQSERMPELQLQFLRIVCFPCFNLIRCILPKTEEIYTNCK